MSEAFIKAEMALFAAQAKEVDIIVTTALIPGKPAPKLITREMVDSMKSGSVVVDLASQNGGNCEYTVPGEVVTTANGVKIIGYTDLPRPSADPVLPALRHQLVNLLKLLCKEKDGNIVIDFDDVVVRGVTVVREGEITGRRRRFRSPAQPQAAAKKSGSAERSGETGVAVAQICADGAGDYSLRLAGQRGAKRVPRPFHRLRAGLRGGLLRGVERLPCAAYAADVGDQCHFGHYRGWRVVADRPRRLGQLPELYRGADRQH